jgi:hypothetical protein
MPYFSMAASAPASRAATNAGFAFGATLRTAFCSVDILNSWKRQGGEQGTGHVIARRHYVIARAPPFFQTPEAPPGAEVRRPGRRGMTLVPSHSSDSSVAVTVDPASFICWM